MEDKEYVIVKTFTRMSPEEMYKRNLNKISVLDYVQMHVEDLERGEAVFFPRKAQKESGVRVAVSTVNNAYKQIYKREGFSEKLRKYSVHREGEGVAVARIV